MKRIVVLVIFGVILSAGVFALLSATLRPIEITTAAATRGAAIETVYATGYVEAKVRRSLKAPRAGVIAAILKSASGAELAEGTEVRAGTPLLELRDTALESRIRAAQAEVDRVTEKLKPGSPFRQAYELRVTETGKVAADDRAREQRMKQQFESSNISRDTYDQARTRAEVSEQRHAQVQQEYDQAIADLTTAITAARSDEESLRAQQADNLIVSPIDGVILRLPFKQGEFVPAGAEVAKVGDQRELIIESEVNEDDIARVQLGQRVLIRLAGYGQTSVDGEVYEILPDADRATKGYTVRVSFSEARFIAAEKDSLRGRVALTRDVEPRSGMTAELGVIVREKEGAIVFPRTALSAQGTVFVVDGSKVTEVKVSLGLTNFSVCEAVAGLKEGQRVATSEVKSLSDGARVSTKE